MHFIAHYAAESVSFDSSLRLCLQNRMPSLMGCASGGLHGSNGTASAPANPPPAAGECLLLFTLVLAGAIVGGGVIIHLLGACISASQPPRSLAGPKPFTAVAVKWRNEGWSRPLLPDHAELAASEQAQLEAARARRGWRPIRRALTSQFDKGTHRRRTTTKQCPPSIAMPSLMNCASGGFSGGNGSASAPANPAPTAGACLLLFTLALAGAIVGGCVNIHLLGACISVSPPPRSLTGPRPFTAVADPQAQPASVRSLRLDHSGQEHFFRHLCKIKMPSQSRPFFPATLVLGSPAPVEGYHGAAQHQHSRLLRRRGSTSVLQSITGGTLSRSATPPHFATPAAGRSQAFHGRW